VAIFGAIIPAPFTVPAIVTLAPDMSSCLTACLALVSVVIIALAKSRPAVEAALNLSTAFAMPAVIFLIGKGLPIMPVDATSTVCGSASIRLAVFEHILIALFIPCCPVQVFALPELTTTAETFALTRCLLQTVTAAESILLVVNTAAAFAPAGHTISPKSLLPDFFMPQLIPAARNPRGDVIVSFVIYKRLFSFRFYRF
jgi:hypothetical protein